MVVEIVLVVLILLFGNLDVQVDQPTVSDGVIWILIAVIVVFVLVVIAFIVFPKLRNKVLPSIKVALHNLRLIVSSPRQLTLLLGGNLASEILFALCLDASLHAYGGSLPLPTLLFVNMAVSVFAGMMPIPGGIGVATAGLTAGMIAFGVPQEVAFAAAITHRLCTFYLPPIWGYFSLRWLRSRSFV